MTQFLSLLLNGLSLGAVYALIALGFVIIFKASEVTSFMQGSLVLLGAYLMARFHDTLGFWGALVVGVGGAAIAALVVERALINRLRGAPVISLAILTIGVDLIIVTELTRRIGSDILNLGHPWGCNVLNLRGTAPTENRALAILVAGVLISASLPHVFVLVHMGLNAAAVAVGWRLWRVNRQAPVEVDNGRTELRSVRV